MVFVWWVFFACLFFEMSLFALRVLYYGFSIAFCAINFLIIRLKVTQVVEGMCSNDFLTATYLKSSGLFVSCQLYYPAARKNPNLK